MEVIVVERFYNNYEDSYTTILGVCMTESKADELIEKDKHKDDYPGYPKDKWMNDMKLSRDYVDSFIRNEMNSPKKRGFLNKFHYNGLTKNIKLVYDKLKEKYNGVNLNTNVYFDMSYEDRFALYQVMGYYTKLSYNEYKKIEDHYCSAEHSDDIYYSKAKFEVL
jgi:hypothetical protein